MEMGNGTWDTLLTLHPDTLGIWDMKFYLDYHYQSDPLKVGGGGGLVVANEILVTSLSKNINSYIFIE